jgi:hypothetical protein
MHEVTRLHATTTPAGVTQDFESLLKRMNNSIVNAVRTRGMMDRVALLVQCIPWRQRVRPRHSYKENVSCVGDVVKVIHCYGRD